MSLIEDILKEKVEKKLFSDSSLTGNELDSFKISNLDSSISKLEEFCKGSDLSPMSDIKGICDKINETINSVKENAYKVLDYLKNSINYIKDLVSSFIFNPIGTIKDLVNSVKNKVTEMLLEISKPGDLLKECLRKSNISLVDDIYDKTKTFSDDLTLLKDSEESDSNIVLYITESTDSIDKDINSKQKKLSEEVKLGEDITNNICGKFSNLLSNPYSENSPLNPNKFLEMI